MRAREVEFERGTSLTKALRVGKDKEFEEGDKILLADYIWWGYDNGQSYNWHTSEEMPTFPIKRELVVQKGATLIYNKMDGFVSKPRTGNRVSLEWIVEHHKRWDRV